MYARRYREELSLQNALSSELPVRAWEGGERPLECSLCMEEARAAHRASGATVQHASSCPPSGEQRREHPPAALRPRLPHQVHRQVVCRLPARTPAPRSLAPLLTAIGPRVGALHCPRLFTAQVGQRRRCPLCNADPLTGQTSGGGATESTGEGAGEGGGESGSASDTGALEIGRGSPAPHAAAPAPHAASPAPRPSRSAWADRRQWAWCIVVGEPIARARAVRSGTGSAAAVAPAAAQ
jgi:hypothetical protein